MAKYYRADILALAGFALEAGAILALWLCYLLQHLFVVGCVLLVLAGCFLSLGLVAFLYATLAVGGNESRPQ